MKKNTNLLRTLYLYLIFWMVRFIISLRYRIRISGLEEIIQKKWPFKGGILFLPNHTAEMDPIILVLALWRQFHLRATAVETFYYQKGIRYFMDLVDVLPLPNMDIPNQWKIKRIEKAKKLLIEKLKEGDNFLIYPSGKLKRTPEERLGGASLVHDILQASPETNIVLIRTTGFWGSMFSCAITGTTPDFGKLLLKGALILLKNGIFFAPRREIHIEISLPPEQFPYRGSRVEVNQFLENWYNQKGPEPVKLISYYFWKEELPHPIEIKSTESQNNVSIPPEIEKDIISHLSQISHQSQDKIQKNLYLSNDLGLDSLNIADLYLYLEEKYNVADLVPGSIQTVADLMLVAAGQGKEYQLPKEMKKKRVEWPKEKERPSPLYPEGKTLHELFLKTCDRMDGLIACADANSGTVSYKKLKQTILILALEISKLPGEKIGILLPASIGANALIFATLLAKKIPVMLNWTVGSKAIEHAVDVAEVKTVLSSYRFLTRMENGDLGKVDDLLLLLEDVRRRISLLVKIKGLFLSFFSSKTLLSYFGLNQIKEEENAVIIFTSGTETLPKGVPLTHRNLLSNHRAALTCIHLKPQDIMYSVLPPFHSFGFSVTGILPLLIGLKVYYAPDPTNSHGMAWDIANWKPTLFICAPSFVKSLFRVAKKEELASIELFVCGAEKTPQELFDYVAQLGPNKKLREGYGISECSPIVTIDPLDSPHKGVGKPVPGVELCIIDAEKGEPLPQGKEGEVSIFGPNVFNGYLGYPASPFIEMQGKRWYRSGDRGYLDSDGTLFITGRLKRFIKISGEMISLGGLEEELLKVCEEKNWSRSAKEGVKLAVVAIGEDTGKAALVLFTTFDVNKEDVNSAIRERGIGRLVKISDVKRLEEIPLTGTGKTHYRALEEMVKK